jgi:hypothetical protein
MRFVEEVMRVDRSDLLRNLKFQHDYTRVYSIDQRTDETRSDYEYQTDVNLSINVVFVIIFLSGLYRARYGD